MTPDMSPDEIELLQQLEAATSARPRSTAHATDSESAALGDGWRVLGQSLRPVSAKPLSPALAVSLTARLNRQTELAIQRRLFLQRTAWFAAAAVAILCSVIAFRAGSVPVEVVEPSIEPNSHIALPDDPNTKSMMTVHEYPADPVIAETEPEPVWNSVDTELEELSSRVDGLRSDWRLTPSYLDYVARRFEQLEYEMAITKL